MGSSAVLKLAVLAFTMILVRGQEQQDRIFPTCSETAPVVTVCTTCVPSDYEKSTPPPKVNGSSRTIQFQFHVLDIKDVNVKSMEMTLQGYLRMFWPEPRLNAECMHVNQSFMMLDITNAQKLWVPDVYVVGVKKIESPALLTKPASLRLYENGYIRYSQYVSITVGCPMFFAKFPMDTQRCAVAFESYGYTADDVVYEWKGIGLERDEKFSVGQFEIKLNRLTPTRNEYAGYVGFFPLLNFEVVLSRKLSHYLMQMFAPSILLIIMSGVSYIIPPNLLPARMLLCVATILSTSTQFSAAQAQLPQVSYMKAIDVWMLACLTFETASLIELCIVVFMKYGRGTDESAASKAKQEKERKEQVSSSNAASREKRVIDVNNKVRPNPTADLPTVASQGGAAIGHSPFPAITQQQRIEQEQSWQLEDRAVPETLADGGGSSKGVDDDAKEPFDPRNIDWVMLRVFPIAFIIFNVAFWPYYQLSRDEND